MPFDILNCWPSFLLPLPRHGGPTSEMWVLLERNELRNPHSCGNWHLLTPFAFHLLMGEVTFSCFLCHRGRHCQVESPAPCGVALGRGATWWMPSFFSASKPNSLPRWHAETVPQTGWTSTNSLLWVSAQFCTLQALFASIVVSGYRTGSPNPLDPQPLLRNCFSYSQVHRWTGVSLDVTCRGTSVQL